MQYGQIVFILFVAMACYYAFLIFTDIRKAQAARNAEKENHTEEEIDISDEARSFHPTKISRDEEKKEETANEKQEETPPDAASGFCRPGYREAIMTDGILVDDLIHEIDNRHQRPRPGHIHLRERKVSKYTLHFMRPFSRSAKRTSSHCSRLIETFL